MRATIWVAMALGLMSGQVQAGESVRGDELRNVVAGKTLHISTAVGTVPVSFRGDGTMSGRSQGLASLAMATSDRGRWWISGDRLCQQWERWLNKEAHCFAMQREGRTLHWSGGGRSGTAMIAN